MITKKLNINEQMVDYKIIEQTRSSVLISYKDKEYKFCLKAVDDTSFVLKSDSLVNNLVFWDGDDAIIDGEDFKVVSQVGDSVNSTKAKGSTLTPMPGKVLKVCVEEGDVIKVGDQLYILEAMKMEHTVKSQIEGKVVKVYYQTGDLVTGGVEVVGLEESSDA